MEVSSELGRQDRKKKKFGPFLDLCVSSLRRGHANLLCIVPILSDVPEGTLEPSRLGDFKGYVYFVLCRCGTFGQDKETRIST